jgi:predicted ATP-binding protein involved in virulence
MRIQQISVEGLFGRFNHSLPLNAEERITLIHGPNGIGKTTILKMVWALFGRRFISLKHAAFDDLYVEFDDGSVLRVHRALDDVDGADKPPLASLTISISPKTRGQAFTIEPLSRRDVDPSFPLGLVERRVDYLTRVAPEEWVDTRTGESLGFEEVVERYGDRLPVEPSPRITVPKWFEELLDEVPTYFIQTQRLFSVDSRPKTSPRHVPAEMASTVGTYSRDLVTTIERSLAQFAALSQRLDRTFPTRLLRQKGRALSEAQIRDTYLRQGERQKRLTAAGLLQVQQDFPPLPKRKLELQHRRILGPYLADMSKKLQLFDDLLERIELFTSIINSSFRYKRLAIDSSDGFVFVTDEGVRLSPTDLSSGEQHKLVLAYELIFRIRPDSFIMIDEPEISLHVTWQHMFLDELSRISQLSEVDFLIATHSPQIIHHRWDLAISLGA